MVLRAVCKSGIWPRCLWGCWVSQQTWFPLRVSWGSLAQAPSASWFRTFSWDQASALMGVAREQQPWDCSRREGRAGDEGDHSAGRAVLSLMEGILSWGRAWWEQQFSSSVWCSSDEVGQLCPWSARDIQSEIQEQQEIGDRWSYIVQTWGGQVWA